MKTRTLIVQLLVLSQLQLLFGLFDNDERIKPQTFGTTTDKYTATWTINKARELTNELWAERDDKTRCIEGDMRIAPLLTQIRATNVGDPVTRGGIAKTLKWKSNIIPYVFDELMTEHKRGAVEAAMKDFHQFTVIRFVQRTNEPDYLNFVKDKGCWSFVGCQGGKQDISIGNGCGYRGTVIHEIMHSLGFFHEHTRLDRERYLTIDSNNIEQGFAHNFEKYENRWVFLTAEYQSQKYSEYDYFSIMHLGCRAFSSLEGKTMMAKDDEVDDNDLGQRDGFSRSDIERLKAAYGELTNGLADVTANDVPVDINTNINLNPNDDTSVHAAMQPPVENLSKPVTSTPENPAIVSGSQGSLQSSIGDFGQRKPPLSSLENPAAISGRRPESFQRPKPLNLLNSLGNNAVISENPGALNPSMENPGDSITGHVNPDIMKQSSQSLSLPTSVGNLGNILTASSGTPGVIPGNPGPGTHNNIGGMAGVDGIGPNGLPVSPNINVLDTTIPPIVPVIPTLLPFNHAVMEGSSVRCNCRHPETTGDCHCGDHNNREEVERQNLLPPANEFPRPPIPTPPPPKTSAPVQPPSQSSTTADQCVSSSFPCWPDDFVWSFDGLPPNCNCARSTIPTSMLQVTGPSSVGNAVCRCNCMKMHTERSDASWNNNLLCFKDTEVNPHFILSKTARLPQMKCLRFPQSNGGWKDTFLCMNQTVPYHLYWSRIETDIDKKQCLTISEPSDSKWSKMYLCNAI